MSKNTSSVHTSSAAEVPATDISPTWYATFFTYLPNEFWRRVATPEWTVAEVDFVESRLGLRAGARILDVPCGSGRHSLALAARGYRVTGVDLSAEALEHARRTAASAPAAASAAAGDAVTFVHGDMRELAGLGVFDAAVCLGNSFGYLDTAGTRAFARALAAVVRPGGGLVIDVGAAAESILPDFTGQVRRMTTGDIVVEMSGRYDVADSRQISQYRFVQGAQELRTTAVHHVRTSGHIGELLDEAGFTDLRRYGGLDGAAYTVGAPRLLVTARRR
ncbi:cyclopropane-fatty-acyl-phospholipid synthase family protein [Frankia sp. R82]|uniref:SAM-dependent methyltransferase n=1 Tax=Frankia sp. R82 TaxID=2950553 RepID=UPI002043676A|nr:class I SAM-dependent methyltransferase [Frankia sp. R82]MCM3883486.1 class I SAM-dependent methyltransferase [Frankia sp. R82]